MKEIEHTNCKDAAIVDALVARKNCTIRRAGSSASVLAVAAITTHLLDPMYGLVIPMLAMSIGLSMICFGQSSEVARIKRERLQS